VFFHHEQAAAMAAEAYARIADRPPILNVTTGPGGINALNGVFGAWTDSVPMIVISGQVKRATCLATTPLAGLRQLGDQECEIVPMVRGITKYAALVERAEDIAWHLDQAVLLATSGRPGRCGWTFPSTCKARPSTHVNFAASCLRAQRAGRHACRRSQRIVERLRQPPDDL
jgi:acetolactate synthase-1/2/3 large subunit